MTLLWTEEEVRQARENARREFLARLEVGGLTVLPAVQEKWWGNSYAICHLEVS